jgi:FKBP-type peptidyl-prolyl cis-trans isomerase (trigger factor)
VFTVTINHIRGEAINVVLTDEIAAEYKFDTKEALIADIEEWIIEQQKLQFFDDLIADVECSEIPTAVLDYVRGLDIVYLTDYAKLNNMDMDTFLATYVGHDSLDAYLEAQTDAHNDKATRYLIVQAIAEAEGLKVTEADITAGGYADYVETHGIPYLNLLLLQSKVVPNFVADNAIVEN